jgi:hypothetical protein
MNTIEPHSIERLELELDDMFIIVFIVLYIILLLFVYLKFVLFFDLF